MNQSSVRAEQFTGETKVIRERFIKRFEAASQVYRGAEEAASVLEVGAITG